MSDMLDNMNLRPMEKRLVIVAAIVVFIVLNIVFVRPHFGDWKMTKDEFANAQKTLGRYQDEIGRKKTYEDGIKRLGQSGEELLPEEAVVQLGQKIQDQASRSGIVPNGLQSAGKPTSRPDQFFEEQSIRMGFQNATEEELIDFLFNLSSGSMIRVRALSVRPDPPMQKLQGDLTLTASYQKRATRALPSITKPPAKTAPAAKPVSSAAPKTPIPKTVMPKPGSVPPKSSPSKATPSKPKPDSASVEK
jgi:hypothetical protein